NDPSRRGRKGGQARRIDDLHNRMNKLGATTDGFAFVPVARESSIGQKQPAVRQVTDEKPEIGPWRSVVRPFGRRVLRCAGLKSLKVGDQGISTTNPLEKVAISKRIEHNPTIGLIS